MSEQFPKTVGNTLISEEVLLAAYDSDAEALLPLIETQYGIDDDCTAVLDYAAARYAAYAHHGRQLKRLKWLMSDNASQLFPSVPEKLDHFESISKRSLFEHGIVASLTEGQQHDRELLYQSLFAASPKQLQKQLRDFSKNELPAELDVAELCMLACRSLQPVMQHMDGLANQAASFGTNPHSSFIYIAQQPLRYLQAARVQLMDFE